MARNIANRLTDELGNSNSSSVSSINAPSTSRPIPVRREFLKDIVEPQEQQLLRWFKRFGIEANEINRRTLGTIRRGPFKDFLFNFCLPYVRSKKWISTMRLNLDLSTGKFYSAEEISEQGFAKAETEIEQCKRQLEELNATEEELIDQINTKYFHVDDLLTHPLFQSYQEKMKKEVEKQYLESRKKSVNLKRKLLEELKELFSAKKLETNDYQSLNELGQMRNSRSIKEFKSILYKLTQKVVKREAAKGSLGEVFMNKEFLKNMQRVVQVGLTKLNCSSMEYLHCASSDHIEAMSKLPVKEFSTGFNEFNKIISDQLLVWSELHIALYEQNAILGDDSYDQELFNNMLETSLSGYYDFTNEQTAYLRLLVEELKDMETLGYYQDLNIDAVEYDLFNALYGSISMASSSNHANNATYTEVPPTQTSFNYEILTEKLLNSLPPRREEINDKMKKVKMRFETEIHQCLEQAVVLMNEDI